VVSLSGVADRLRLVSNHKEGKVFFDSGVLSSW